MNVVGPLHGIQTCGEVVLFVQSQHKNRNHGIPVLVQKQIGIAGSKEALAGNAPNGKSTGSRLKIAQTSLTG
jgi:hypothetical protein